MVWANLSRAPLTQRDLAGCRLCQLICGHSRAIKAQRHPLTDCLLGPEAVSALKLQERFFASLVRYVTDMEDGTVILVDPEGLIDTRYIDANTWNLPLVLQYVHKLAIEWESKPTVHRLLPDWREPSLHNPLEIKAVDYTWGYVIVPWDKALVLRTSAGEVVGRLDDLEIREERFQLNQMMSTRSRPFQSGYFHDELILGR